MPPLHHALLMYVRAREIDGPLAAKLAGLSDAALLRQMFSSFRGGAGGRGLRLTHFGLLMMERWFLGCEVRVPEDEPWHPSSLLYLDSKATMPYYCSNQRLVLYDLMLGTRLKLASGRISILIAIEGGR